MKNMESPFYNEKQNFLFVKTENDGEKLSDYIFIHKDETTGKGFLAHFESYKDDIPLEVYSLNKVPEFDVKGLNTDLCQTDYTEEVTWKRLRIKAILPTTWKILFDQIISKLKIL